MSYRSNSPHGNEIIHSQIVPQESVVIYVVFVFPLLIARQTCTCVVFVQAQKGVSAQACIGSTSPGVYREYRPRCV